MKPSSPAPADAASPDAPLGPAWRLFEAAFRRLYGIEPLGPDALLAWSRCRHSGPDVRLRCGALVRRGDPLLEVHFRREALRPLVRAADPARLGLGLVRLADRDVPRLARLLARDPRLREVRAVHALTLFHRGIGRYGFEVLPAEGISGQWFSAWFRLLMARDHPGGARHVREHRHRLVARHVWISREELLRRYPAGPGEAVEPAAGMPPGTG